MSPALLTEWRMYRVAVSNEAMASDNEAMSQYRYLRYQEHLRVAQERFQRVLEALETSGPNWKEFIEQPASKTAT